MVASVTPHHASSDDDRSRRLSYEQTKATYAFRELRERLEKEGWWKLNPIREVKCMYMHAC